MRPGACPYWHCGGDILTRALDRDGALVARPVGPDEAHRLLALYDEAQASRLARAIAAADAWRRAALMSPKPS